MGFQGRVDEALGLLDQAKEELGDRGRSAARVCQTLGIKERTAGSEGLMDLSQDVEKFSTADRKRLLNGLALEFVRQQDLEGASRLWTRLAAENPANIDLRLNLLDLALQNATRMTSKRTSSRSRRSKGMRVYWVVTVK